MRCPKKKHDCTQSFFLPLVNKKYYICSGYNKKPTKYKYDKVSLCLMGKFVKNSRFEMTVDEALSMSSALAIAAGNIQIEQVIRNKKYKKKGKK